MVIHELNNVARNKALRIVHHQVNTDGHNVYNFDQLRHGLLGVASYTNGVPNSHKKNTIDLPVDDLEMVLTYHRIHPHHTFTNRQLFDNSLNFSERITKPWTLSSDERAFLADRSAFDFYDEQTNIAQYTWVWPIEGNVGDLILSAEMPLVIPKGETTSNIYGSIHLLQPIIQQAGLLLDEVLEKNEAALGLFDRTINRYENLHLTPAKPYKQ